LVAAVVPVELVLVGAVVVVSVGAAVVEVLAGVVEVVSVGAAVEVVVLGEVEVVALASGKVNLKSPVACLQVD
jgi:hypothetical protein